MREDSLDIDSRHMQLLKDIMTFKGDVLGITRFGLAKMRDSTLQLASFEKTTDHLFEAVFHMKRDAAERMSECIILGQSIGISMGALKDVRRLVIGPRNLVAKRLKMCCNQTKKLGLGRPLLRPPSFFRFREF